MGSLLWVKGVSGVVGPLNLPHSLKAHGMPECGSLPVKVKMVGETVVSKVTNGESVAGRWRDFATLPFQGWRLVAIINEGRPFQPMLAHLVVQGFARQSQALAGLTD